jgi:hypothetical protein
MEGVEVAVVGGGRDNIGMAGRAVAESVLRRFVRPRVEETARRRAHRSLPRQRRSHRRQTRHRKVFPFEVVGGGREGAVAVGEGDGDDDEVGRREREEDGAVIIMTRPTPCIMCVHRQHLFASVDLHDC